MSESTQAAAQKTREAEQKVDELKLSPAARAVVDAAITAAYEEGRAFGSASMNDWS
jgi:hypothetical protein